MANTLTRWDPVADLAAMRSFIDRVYQAPARFPVVRNDESASTSLGLDIFETGNEFVIKVNLPGIDPTDVEIGVEDDVLTIKGESKHESEAQEGNYVRRELRHGSFARSLRLPLTVDAEKAKAGFEHGVLKLTLPKRPEARARSIKITPQGVVESAAAKNDGEPNQS